jgi:hypothetical protein
VRGILSLSFAGAAHRKVRIAMCGKNAHRPFSPEVKRVVDTEKQHALMEKVEALFLCYDGAKPLAIVSELKKWGFVERGADPACIILVHPHLELFLDIGLTAEGNIHSYELLPFDKLNEKQEKYRW